MSEQLNPKTLDLVGVLTGRDYPELDVPVYFNEKLGFEIYQINKQIREAEARADEKKLKALDKELAEKIKATESERYVVTLVAIPSDVYRAIVAEVNEKHPDEATFPGMPSKPNPLGDALFTRKLWEAYIRTVTGPDGSQSHVGPDEIEVLISKAPDLAQASITRGISELRSGSAAGFEEAVKDLDFLSPA